MQECLRGNYGENLHKRGLEGTCTDDALGQRCTTSTHAEGTLMVLDSFLGH